MAHRVATNAAETSSTTGTGAKTLSAALTGSIRFNAIPSIAVSDTLPVIIIEVDGSGNRTGAFEYGLYTYSAANQITATTIYGSSNAGAAVNFTGTLWAFCSPLAEDLVNLLPDNSFELDALSTTPVAPATAKLKVFARTIANRAMLAQRGPSGVLTSLQPFIGRNRIKWWQAAGNSTTITAVGAAALTATGTATAVNVATTNVYTRTRQLEYLVTTAATTAVAGFREGVAQLWLSSTAGLGGFFFVCQFGIATGVTTSTRRAFCGMGSSTAAPTDVQPSSITNIAGVGYDAADTNWQVMHNDGTGTATKVDTGIVRPSADRTSHYELAMFAPPGGGQVVYVAFTDLNSGTVYTYTISSTDLPALNTMLAARGWASVGGTSSVVGVGLGQLYLESDS